MIHFQEEDIQKMERRFRANLLNKVSGIKPANLIGTADASGDTNLAIFNSVLHVGANPFLLGILFRPLTVDRHTYENLKSTGCFTINQVHQANYRQAHQTSAKYEDGVSEFSATGLTPMWHEGFPAPFVAESKIRIGLELEEEHLIRANDTMLVVGRVKHLFLPEGSIQEDGDLEIADLETIGVSGLDAYYSLQRLERLNYARPK